MDDDEFFEILKKQMEGDFSERTAENYKLMVSQWDRLAGVIPEMNNYKDERDWLEGELGESGLDLRALMMFALKLAIAKNVPPMDFSSTFASGYIHGFLSALESRGEDAFTMLEERRPPDAPRFRRKKKRARETTVEKFLVMDGAELPETMDMQEIGEFLRTRSREIGREFESPDEDWRPIMLVSTEQGTTLLGLDIPEGDQFKDVLFREVLPQVVRERIGKPEAVGILLSAWTLSGESNEANAEWLRNRPRGEQIADHPDRTETLFIYLMDSLGDQEMWTAKILRDDEQAPGLDEWKRLDEDGIHGRISDMMEGMFDG